MATIDKIKKETGEEKIIIKEINNDLNGLIVEINKFRSKEKQNNPNSDKTEKIFITESLDFYEQTIDLEINFSDCVFEKKVKLYNCTFLHRAYLDNTTFEDLVDFYGCTFKEPQQFYKTDFNEVAIFSNATFEQEAQFIYCTTDISSSYISFQSAKFKKGFDIARANFNCKVSCWDIQVEDKGLLEAINSDYYFSDFNLKWLDENRNNKKELAKWTPASKKLRESMRFIKNNFYAENNRIEGSQFEKKELEVYKKELQNNTTEDISSILCIVASIIVSISLCIICPLFIILLVLYFIGAILYYGNDLFSLYLNKLSNNFGTSWIRGIVFTISAGIITFSLMAKTSELKWDVSEKGFNRVLNNTIKIINVFDTNPFDKENNKDCKAENKENKKNEKDDDILFSNINGITFFILIIGRIFIAYGSYQTVQAFRKYGKS